MRRENAFYFMVACIWLDANCNTAIDKHIFCLFRHVRVPAKTFRLCAHQTWNRYRIDCASDVYATSYTQRQLKHNMTSALYSSPCVLLSASDVVASAIFQPQWTQVSSDYVCVWVRKRFYYIIIYTWCRFPIHLFIYFYFIWMHASNSIDIFAGKTVRWHRIIKRDCG